MVDIQKDFIGKQVMNDYGKNLKGKLMFVNFKMNERNVRMEIYTGTNVANRF